MIAFLNGRLADIQAGAVVIDVGGIGYHVQVPLSLIHNLPEPGGQIMLHTHLAVREDDISLYGFRERGELEYFLKLLNVSGVGPKGALAVLTLFEPGELGQAIVNEDLPALTRVPGIGKKTAGRIILELKDKIPLTAIQDAPGRKQVGLKADAVAALEALGYSAAEAHKGVKEALAGFNEEPPVAELIKKALRMLVKS
ncbi:Holliday junction ATP-dependent DNA helicase RuvA [Pelotomaculum sp. FP]|uniref:Holliday junction branch migration protein RuvA n=1 Tax=Pelotomaculum sp. FP TaxID=261474 RepID=UPI0010666E80|nr:Holliday junction branch migration protein RuvA [Pelotomaculum sp. FP]TEB13069.1 Holliday junction ATP-dependent DNA helicase RuvA [Pelotomaculum sp. FP]